MIGGRELSGFGSGANQHRTTLQAIAELIAPALTATKGAVHGDSGQNRIWPATFQVFQQTSWASQVGEKWSGVVVWLMF